MRDESWIMSKWNLKNIVSVKRNTQQPYEGIGWNMNRILLPGQDPNTLVCVTAATFSIYVHESSNKVVLQRGHDESLDANFGCEPMLPLAAPNAMEGIEPPEKPAQAGSTAWDSFEPREAGTTAMLHVMSMGLRTLAQVHDAPRAAEYHRSCWNKGAQLVWPGDDVGQALVDEYFREVLGVRLEGAKYFFVDCSSLRLGSSIPGAMSA